ncbi:MAG: single-stranded-DNA-specific exonuclease RecJ [Helicobacteraceae bacterium]|jgi:single-stranded-DNA-specific exonuclease|nr:single-stranded-DNA-specific exonuclease RecJ [Helicobacteraceae bacterium]
MIDSFEELSAILQSRFENDAIKKLNQIESPSAFKGMREATERIALALEEGEAIEIVGDYDADGVIASVILSDFFDCAKAKFPKTKYGVYLPDRFKEGYGVSPQIIDRIKANLIVTVDNGINAIETAKRAKELGKTLIITDHHICPETPPQAYAIINPRQPDCPSKYKELCGASIAWYFAASLTRTLGVEFDLNEALAFVALASIADCVALNGANRALTKTGIKRLNLCRRPYAIALKSICQAPIDSEQIAFKIAPKINAAGRIEHSRLAYDFLRSETIEEAFKRLAKLDDLAKRRKIIEEAIIGEALTQCTEKESAIVVSANGWNEGAIGIAAARLAERFYKPAIAIAINGQNAKASARSYGEIDILSLIASCEKYVKSFGGHKKAAGINLAADRIDEFKKAFYAAASRIKLPDFVENRAVLGELNPLLIARKLCEIIDRFEPFGEGNPRPIFIAKNMLVKDCKKMGQDGAHLRLILSCDRVDNLEAILFFADRLLGDRKLNIGDRVSFHYAVFLDSFNGVSRLRLRVEKINA